MTAIYKAYEPVLVLCSQIAGRNRDSSATKKTLFSSKEPRATPSLPWRPHFKIDFEIDGVTGALWVARNEDVSINSLGNQITIACHRWM